MDPRVAAVVEGLKSGEEERAERARDALEALGAAAVPDALALVLDPDERVRAAAIGHAARHGDGAPATLRAVIRGAQASLRTFSDASPAAAIHDAVLGLQGPVEALLPVLLEDSSAGDPGTRLAAFRDLETVTHYLETAGSDGEALLAVLLGALGAAEPEVRWWAVGSLGNLALDPARCVPALAAVLRDGEAVVRLAALEALERFGPDAEGAVPAPLPLLRDADPDVAGRAALAAARTGGGAGAVVDALASLLASPEPRLRAVAAVALGETGNAPRPVREAMAAAAVKDPDDAVRHACAWAVDRIRARHGIA